MRSSFLLAAIALAAATLPVHAAPELSVEEQAAFASLRRSMQPGETYALSLGSPEQYAYVKAMLRLAGATEALAAVDAARAGSSSAPPAMVAPLAAGQAGSLNVIEYLVAEPGSATVALLSTVPGGTTSTTMMVSLILGDDTQPFATSPQYQQVNDGRHFVETFRATVRNGGKPVTASALFIITQQGVPNFYSMMTVTGPGLSTSQCVTGPNRGKRQTGAVPCPGRKAACTNGKDAKKDITVCLGRAKGDCNYVSDDPPTKFPLTIAGSMEFPAPIDPALTGSYLLDLQSEDGACAVTGNGKALNPLSADFFSVDPQRPNVLRYCIPNTAVPPSGCVKRGAKLYLSLTVYARANAPDGSHPMLTAVVSADPAVAKAAPFVARIPAIKVTK